MSISRLLGRFGIGSECRGAGASLSAYVDGRLDDGARERVERHVARCGRCRTEMREQRRLAALLGESLPAAREPEELRRGLARAKARVAACRGVEIPARPSWLAFPESALPVLGAALLVLLALAETVSVSGLEEDVLAVALYLDVI